MKVRKLTWWAMLFIVPIPVSFLAYEILGPISWSNFCVIIPFGVIWGFILDILRETK